MKLRIQVDSGGCSGFQYVFNMEHYIDPKEQVEEYTDIEEEEEEEEEEPDIVFEKDGAHVVIDPSSLGFLRGSTIDYEQELIRSGTCVFVFAAYYCFFLLLCGNVCTHTHTLIRPTPYQTACRLERP